MKSTEIKNLFEQFENASQIVENIACWSARNLQGLLGYSKWENFNKVIDKAKDACTGAGQNIADHFPDVRKVIEAGKGARHEISDILLTRYACYLIAQNGDPKKTEISFAQTYFAVQTRKAELVEQRIREIERIKARDKLAQTEKNLSGVLYERGVDEKGFAIIRSRGDQALFSLNTTQLKKKMNVPLSRAVADFLPTVSIKAKDLAAEMTSVNVQAKSLYGEQSIGTEHVDNNKAVRRMLLDRGIIPENLPPAEDVKKVERRLKKNEKEESALLPQNKK